MLSKALISNCILPSFTTHPPQHSHLCYIHFGDMLIFYWPTLRRSNRCPVKFSLQSYWHAPITKHSKIKSPLQPSRFYLMFEIFIMLRSCLCSFLSPIDLGYWLATLSWYQNQRSKVRNHAGQKCHMPRCMFVLEQVRWARRPHAAL